MDALRERKNDRDEGQLTLDRCASTLGSTINRVSQESILLGIQGSCVTGLYARFY